MATSKNYGKKKGSDHFRDILNPYGEKSNYGKIGRRRRLSKLNVLFFFHNSVGDHKHNSKLTTTSLIMDNHGMWKSSQIFTGLTPVVSAISLSIVIVTL